MSTSETAAANGNGAAHVDPIDPIDRIIGELEEQLAPLASRRSQLESEVADILKAEDRIKAGITALRSGAPKPKAGQGKGGRPPSPASPAYATWRPAQATLDDIYAALATAAEPLSIQQLIDHPKISVSRGTVEKCVAVLRQEERVRIAGQSGQARLYAPMPS